MKNVLLLLMLCLMAQFSLASIITAVSDGAWNQNSTWDNTHPGCYDTIVIPATYTVTITSTEDIAAECSDTIVIIVNGTLEFQTGKKLKLPCGSDVYIESGASMGVGSGGGSSTYLEICDDEFWNASLGDVSGPSVLCGSGDCGISLSVELMSFYGYMNDKERGVDLYWQTASETNNDYFTVYRSKDGAVWEEVCQQEGAGNTSATVNYSDFDPSPFMGITYYRLKQTDYDGIYSYSEPIAIMNQATHFDGEMVVFGTNPNGIINVFLKNFDGKEANIRIYSSTGQLIFFDELFVSGDGVITIQLPSPVAGGVYLVHAEAEIDKIVSQ